MIATVRLIAACSASTAETGKAELFVSAKTHIEAAEAHYEAGERSILTGNQSMRAAAELLFVAKEKHRAKEREIAKAIGKSLGWVNTLLNWHKDGYQSETPFGPASKLARQRKKRVQATEHKRQKRTTTTEQESAAAARAQAEAAKAEA